MPAQAGGFRCGIEHESALLRPDGRFADFTNTTFAELQSIVDELPISEDDYPGLRVGDLGIKLKRWYVEGFERFDDDGELLRCDPKGIEIRTVVHDDVAHAVAALAADYKLLDAAATSAGFTLVTVGFNPFEQAYRVEPELNAWERAHRVGSPEDRTAHLHMTTYGPDLNLSFAGMDHDALIDAGAKLTHYSPYIVPFTFCSPFYGGKPWGGLSVRTHIRTGRRPAAMVFLPAGSAMLDSDPSLTQPARIPAEAGRIEFKAFDPGADFELYADLLALLKGIVLDTSLPGRRIVPDAELHQASAWAGYHDPEIRAGADDVLSAAAAALDLAEAPRIAALRARWEAAACASEDMIECYEAGEAVAGLRKS
ncbi:MAG: glutamate-cysteine ligase family protein [Pseudonocardia sp.]